jgi:hypothetical protein
MANSDRKIIRGVLVGATMYVPGKEDELDALLSASEVKRLSDKGYIEGKWSGGAAEPEPPKTAKKEK